MGLIKNMIKNWLDIKENDGFNITIDKATDFEVQAFINRIWYRGKAKELDQLYSQDINQIENNFWASKPTAGMSIRKIHVGLPSLMVDTLADISTDDLSKIEVIDREEEWKLMDKEIHLKDLLNQSVKDALVAADGVFKYSYDPTISKYPIIEFYPGDKVDFIIKRGRIVGYKFKTKKNIKNNSYMLYEIYTVDGIKYELYDNTGNVKNISDFPELSNYQPIINHSKFMMAYPLILFKGENNRGKSILEDKIPSFDSLDEIWSQWMLAVRKGQMKEYIPDCLLPRDPKTGQVIKRNDFDISFVLTESDMSEEGNKSNKIETTQGEIQHDALLSSYVTALDQCLSGVISPSTLGIDTKKLDNAEAQREKEKTTLYRRSKIVEVLTETIPELINIQFKMYDNCRKIPIKETKATATFGGYANPSFEAQVETIGKASTTNTMSIEAQVEELWGSSKSDEWKTEEVKRIKNEKGIIYVEEPSIKKDIEKIVNKPLIEIEKEDEKNV